MATYWGMEV